MLLPIIPKVAIGPGLEETPSVVLTPYGEKFDEVVMAMNASTLSPSFHLFLKPFVSFVFGR